MLKGYYTKELHHLGVAFNILAHEGDQDCYLEEQQRQQEFRERTIEKLKTADNIKLFEALEKIYVEEAQRQSSFTSTEVDEEMRRHRMPAEKRVPLREYDYVQEMQSFKKNVEELLANYYTNMSQ